MAKPKSKKMGKGKKGRVCETAPIAVAGNSRAMRSPKMISTPNGVVLQNMEPLYQGAYQLKTAAASRTKWAWFIGPGRVGTFAGGVQAGLSWATNVGLNYQYYRFRKAVLHFRPRVPTTFGGYQTLAVLYDSEDYSNWISSASYGLLSQAGTSVTGPFWNELSLPLDVKRIHARVPWFVLDSSVAVDTEQPRANQAVGAFFAWETSPFAPDSDTYLGDWFLEYELEFVHPTPRDFQGTPGVTSRGVTGPVYPPGRTDPLPPLPPPRPSPTNEAEELEY